MLTITLRTQTLYLLTKETILLVQNPCELRAMAQSSYRMVRLVFNSPLERAGTGVTIDSNTLDDYEEGTWTPANTFMPITNNKQATYIKIGNLVNAWFDITYDDGVLDASPSAFLGDLPFAAIDQYFHNVNFRVYNADGSAVTDSSGSNGYAAFLRVNNGVNSTFMMPTSGDPSADQLLTRADMGGKRVVGMITYHST